MGLVAWIKREWQKDRYKYIKKYGYITYIRVTTVRMVEWLTVFQIIIGLYCWDARATVQEYDVHFRFPDEVTTYKLKGLLLMIQMLLYVFAINVLLHRLNYRGIGYDGSLLTRLSFHIFMIMFSIDAGFELLALSKILSDKFETDFNGPFIEIDIYYDEVVTDSKLPYGDCVVIAYLLDLYAKIMIGAVAWDLFKWFCRLSVQLFRYLKMKRDLKKAAGAKSA